MKKIIRLTERDLTRIIKRVLSEDSQSEFESLMDDENNDPGIIINTMGKAKRICQYCIAPKISDGTITIDKVSSCKPFCTKGKINRRQAVDCAEQLKNVIGGDVGFGGGACVLKMAKDKWKS